MKSRKHIKVNANNIVDNVKENNDSYNIDYDMFTTEEMIPAAGQGVLALQGRAGEDYAFLYSFCSPLLKFLPRRRQLRKAPSTERFRLSGFFSPEKLSEDVLMLCLLLLKKSLLRDLP